MVQVLRRPELASEWSELSRCRETSMISKKERVPSPTRCRYTLTMRKLAGWERRLLIVRYPQQLDHPMFTY